MEWWCNIGWWDDLTAVLRNLAIVVGGGYGLWLARSRTLALDRQAETQSRQANNQQRQADLSRQQHELEVLRELTAVLNRREAKPSERVAAIRGMSILAGSSTSEIGDAVADVFMAHQSEAKESLGELRREDEEKPQSDREAKLIEAYLFEWVEKNIEEAEKTDG